MPLLPLLPADPASAQKEKTVIPAPDGSPSLLSPADNAYIRSGGFKLRFGDWEKAWRLEKAKSAQNIPVSNQIFLNGRNITGEIEELRKNRNASTLRHIGKLLGKEITKKEYLNSDSGLKAFAPFRTLFAIRFLS